MTENTTPAGNNPANTTGGKGNTTTKTNNGKPTTKKKKWINKKKNKGKGNRKPMGPPFEGLSKEDAFKGVVIECGKPAIQSRDLCQACKAHSNTKNQPQVADSIKYKKPLQLDQFITAATDLSKWMVPDRNNGTKVNPDKKSTKEMKINYLVKYQSQEYQKVLTFVQTL